MVLALCSVALASAENNGRGSKAIALGNAFVAIADNAWAGVYNPAGLVQLSATQGAVFFIPQQFGLAELRTASLAVAVPFSFASIGLSIEQFGFELYRETNVTIAAGRSIDWGVSAGIALNLHRISIERYGVAQRVTIDLGLLAQAQDDLSFGFAMKNLAAATIGQTRERMPQMVFLGARYAPWKEFQMTVECEKDTRHPLIVKAGVEQRFLEIIALRLGISTNPDKFSAGIGARYSIFEFSYAGYSHPQLGWTHQIEISFLLGE
jgi:long-subunit fatty acid transport protein